MAVKTRKHPLWRSKTFIVPAILMILAIPLVRFAVRIATDGPRPGFGFGWYTGLSWPSNAHAVRSGDSHGGFQGDGVFYVVFETDEATIRGWLAGPAPWGGGWKRGPIPGEVVQSDFGTSGIAWGGEFRQPRHYIGDAELVRLLSSDRVRYVVRKRGGASMPWHNGDLLFIDPETHRVFLAVWD